MKKIFKAAMLLSMLLAGYNSFSQSKDSSTSFKCKYAVYMNLVGLDPGVLVNMDNGWVGHAECGPGFYLEYVAFRNPELLVGSNTVLRLGLDYYPWLKKRIRNGKNTMNFTGTYFSASLLYNLKVNPQAVDTIGPRVIRGNPFSVPLFLSIGYRTSFLKYGLFNVSLGPALIYDHYAKNFEPNLWYDLTFAPAIFFPKH